MEIGYLATRCLLERKRRRIAHIRGPENSIGKGRLRGYQRALSEAGKVCPDGYVVGTETVDVDSTTEGHIAMQQLLALSPRPDAVFCYSAPIAIGAINAVTEAGQSVPERQCGSRLRQPAL